MDAEERLASWLSGQFPEAEEVRVANLDRAAVGHSAETFLLALTWRDRAGNHRREVALRVRPPSPGLLEPYDLKRQFDILRGLEGTEVRAPRAMWFDATGEVLGREFYVMERLPGSVYERTIPPDLSGDPNLVGRMCESMVDQLAAVHRVDLQATGLHAIADGRRYLDRELDHWQGEIRRVQRGPLSAIERLISELRSQQPPPCPAITLVHGDAKPGNFAFEGGEVSALFDWEMATIGDPLADVGWAELLWSMPGEITALAGAPSIEELVARWEIQTGIVAANRSWYRALECLKMSAIMLVAGSLFDAGHTDDVRFLQMAYVVDPMTQRGLAELGVDERLDPGPLLPRQERIAEVEDVLSKSMQGTV